MYEFEAKLQKLEGKIKWTVFYIPFSVKEEFDTLGRVYVNTYIDGFQFEGILLPSKKGHYMVFNKDMQKVVNKKVGDTINVKLEKNQNIRVLTIPDIIIKKLKQNPKLLTAFNNLPYYVKKGEIDKIMSAKKEETKIKRLDNLIQRLLN